MRIRIAAIQPALVVGDVEGNLERVEDLVRDAAAAHRPDLIVLPEAFSSPNTYDPAIRNVPRPIDGAPFVLLRELARELGCVVAGGALLLRGPNAYGTYMAHEPDGRAHLHDKDIPSGTETYFYAGGDDDGITSIAAWNRRRVGLVSGLEWGRTGTARRLRDARVELVIGGQCWPWTPTNWRGPVGRWMTAEYERSIGLAAAVPSLMARYVGAPSVMASHVGPIAMRTPYVPGVPWKCDMVGETRICDADGNTLASLSLADGEGHISALVELGSRSTASAPPDEYWTIDMPPAINVLFHGLNAVAAVSYRARKAVRRFPWQDVPATDLPDEVGPRRTGRLPAPARPTIPVVVTDVRAAADSTVGITLRAKDGGPLPTWTPGAHIDLVVDADLTRQYSLCGEPGAATYDIAVLREPEGRGGSLRICDTVRVGDELAVRGPRNHFAFSRSARSVLFIAGGIGITPILAMAREAAGADLDWRLIYTARTANRLAFREELTALDPHRVELRTDDVDGILPVEDLVRSLWRETHVYACGPSGLLTALEDACARRGVPLRVERFTAKILDTSEDVGFDLVAASTGTTIRVPAYRTALQAVRDAGIEIDSSCETGICGSCQVRVLDGTPDQRDSITTRRGLETEKVMMLCVSRARTETLTVDL